MRGCLALPLLAVLACHRAGAGHGDLRIAVDPRVELMTTVWYLAEAPEYQRAYDTPYRRAVDEHFAPFRGHAAVAAASQLRKRGVGYDAPVALAAYLDPVTFAPLRPLDPLPPGLDPRVWQGVNLGAFVEKVQDFARASDDRGFFASQRARFDAVEERYRAYLADKPIIPWFDGVFGPRPRATHHLAPGLLTGPMAYGVRAVRADGGEEIMQVMYLERVNGQGLPQLGENTLEYLVHELCHSYVNPTFEASDVAASAQPLLEKTAEAMRRQAYTTPLIVVNESVVRAVVVLFLRERSSAAHAERSLHDQVDKFSFLWTPELVAALDGLRQRSGGRLPADALVEATRATLRAWAQAH